MTMRTRIGVVVVLGTIGIATFGRPAATTRQQPLTPAAAPASPSGQTATRLADGRWLLLGGQTASGPLASATIIDPQTGISMPLAGPMTVPRADHSATLLADGTVLIVGGRTTLGQVVATAEIFDPQTTSIVPLAIPGGTPRAGQTATLLSDGRVLVVGGATDGGHLVRDLEIWDVAGQTVRSAGALHYPRAGQTATLLFDGRVLLSNGVGAGGAAVTQDEIFDPASQAVAATVAPVDDGAPARLAASNPPDAALDVPSDVRVSLRFSRPLQMETVNATTVTLSGPDGQVDAFVVPAEGGRLVFVTPRRVLDADRSYTLKTADVVDATGVPLVMAPLTFVTAREKGRGESPDEEAWVPDLAAGANGWQSGRAPSSWQALPPLQAPPGVTALAGQVLRLDGQPLQNVTLAMEGRTARTDNTGRFLLTLDGLQTGGHTLAIDGRTANRGPRTYGFYEAQVLVKSGVTTALPFTIWSPVLDTAHAVTIPSPTTAETVVTTPTMPGLELHLPAGTVIRDEEKKVARTLTLTPIPLDRTPFPLPAEASFTMFFTIQPGGAYLSVPGWLVYPNLNQSRVGKRVQFFSYDPDDKGWYVYGMGTVGASTVVPDATTRIYAFTGASFNDGNTPPPTWPPPGDCCGNGGDPVSLTTGIFTTETTDLVVPDVLPLALTRTYNAQDPNVRAFGTGWNHPYGMFQHSEQYFEQSDLILPDGGRIHYVRTSAAGLPWYQTVFENQSAPTGFYKSKIVFVGGAVYGGGWVLTRQDGTVYIFGHQAPLQLIRDRNGNEIRLTWSDTNLFGWGVGNLVRVTSPSGRWIAFTYYAGTTRIYQATDNLGRTVTYGYDAQGNLTSVTDPENHVTSYAYDTSNRMVSIKPPSLQGTPSNLVTNEYTTAADAPVPVGWVKKQTHADGGVYQFAYTVVNGKSTQTDVIDPRGHTRRVTFNPDGYTGSDTRAYGEGDAQTASSDRQPGSNFVTSSTNTHGDVTTTDYDSLGLGRVTRVIRLPGTADEAITTYTYDPVWPSEVATITDPLTHTTSFEYDSRGNRKSVTDALTHKTTFTYNSAGQVTSVTDPLQHTTTYDYVGPDVVTITDPLGRVTRRFVDAAGRPLTQTDPAGQTTRFTYDKVNHLTQVSDPLSGLTTYGYDTAGRLASLTDARNHATTYGYDTLDRLASRTDPLANVETFTYDEDGNPSHHVDRKGQVTTRAHDALNRLHQITYADTSTTTYTYDSGNRLTTIADSLNGTITRTYDNLDRLTSETTAQGSISYTYDKADRRTTMTVAGQPTVSYGYDDANRLTSVTQGTAVVLITYDNADRRSTLTLPNGILVTYGYDNADQLTALTYALGQTTLGTLTYAYDLAGRRTEVGGTWARTGLPADVASAVYDVANRLTQWAGTGFSYDPNGNLASDGPTSYSWNARDQLMGLSGSTSVSFAYDGFGRRRSKTVAGPSTNFLYDGINLVQELAGSTPTANLLTGLGIDETFARTDAGGASTLLIDALGSALALADASATVQTQYTFDPFGVTTASGAANSNALQFTGREQDVDSIYHLRARSYSAAMHRFLSEDPITLSASPNPYVYAGNSPLNFIDPLGLLEWNVQQSANVTYTSLDNVHRVCSPTAAGCTSAHFEVTCNCTCTKDGWKLSMGVSLTYNFVVVATDASRSARWLAAHELHHVADNAAVLNRMRPSAEALERKRYPSEGACRFACNTWRDRAAQQMGSRGTLRDWQDFLWPFF